MLVVQNDRADRRRPIVGVWMNLRKFGLQLIKSSSPNPSDFS
jgi:hypothetical protein